MKILLFRTVLIVIFILYSLVVNAKVELPAIISDNMLLQRNSEVHLWGKTNRGKEIKITTSWNGKTVTIPVNVDGYWQTDIETGEGGGPYEIIFDDGDIQRVKNVLLGEVWLLSGQSNMEMSFRGLYNQPTNNALDAIIEADDPQIRLFKNPRSWSILPVYSNNSYWTDLSSNTAETCSAAGYYFAKILQKKLNVPVGLLCVYWGGSTIESWMSDEALAKLMKIDIPDSEISNKNANGIHTLLYNGLIAPIVKYTIKGALWYQGEANVSTWQHYDKLFPAMVEDWRLKWEYDFPFYYAQLAPYSYENSKGIESALLREAQYKSTAIIPNSGMISLVDNGEETCIHPKNKEIVGKRFAYLALDRLYGVKGISSEAPKCSKTEVVGSQILVHFENVKYGITSYREELTGFEIAGNDRVFYPAKARIIKGKPIIELSSELVPMPIAVRYCFRNYAYGNLYSTYGIPAASFRTDSW